MKWETRLFLPVAIATLAALMGACEGMTDNYRQYLESGEIFYPGKPDSIEVYPGKNRIQLQWRIVSDPSITEIVVYWNNKRNSQTVPVSRTGGIDTINVTIENLEEQTYTFEIYSLDANGNRSVAAQAIGTAYGEKYRQSLFSRGIGNILLTEEENLQIQWGPADAGTTGEEITWTDRAGDTRTLSMPVDSAGALLEDFDLSIKNFTVYTSFKPDSLAIDTFRITETVSFQIMETPAEINRSGFSLKDLPGDYSEPNSTNNTVDKIWTNDYAISNSATSYFMTKAWAITACADLVPFPYWFTIDMGATYNLSSLTLWQRGDASTATSQLYTSANPKEFEIWGALEVDESYNPKDHSNVFDANWILLEACELVPPANSADRLPQATAGDSYDLSVNGNIHRVRYLRFKFIDNFLASTGSCPVVQKRTYINFNSIKVLAVQRVVIF
jgi:hypothetical protein